MTILIAAPFCSLPGEPYFNRFRYLAEMLAERHDVLLLTSRFRHYDKSFRRPEDAAAASSGRLKVELIDEAGYTENVSTGRLKSHHGFVRRLDHWLHGRRTGEFGLVYSAYPLIASNLVLGRHKARLGYKLLIDVQDVWPESFSAVLPALKHLPPRLFPFARKADRAYACADALAAVSESYLARARAANPAVPHEAVYIGADCAAVAAAPALRFEAGRTRLFYLGTLSHSYDVETVCRGVRLLRQRGEDVELHICGGGGDAARLQTAYAASGTVFHGYLPYADMLSLAKGCDMAVNPIHSYAPQSVTNKLSDYMVLQKPVLNSQTHPEVRRLLHLLPHENYASGNAQDFAAAFGRLKNNAAPVQTQEIARLFDRRLSYRRLAALIESLLP
ncbi:Glycosyl transferases group 1 [Kingella potus]|uniref:Glycosyl transferases group 1 n=1 Tax=Kingella potus TaxID=265175 RepID=A0A377R2K1_9NEIS|nr:glycosyltransferase [Kingella potus]STR00978.1 Glycosyl transferases group 1 [Kingella potus]